MAQQGDAVVESDTRRLLINFVYAHPVGHAIEALHYAFGYHVADPSLMITLLLNAATPWELAGLCPWIEAVHPIPFDMNDPSLDPTPALRRLPRQWEWIVADDRGRQPAQRALFPGLARYYDAAAATFTAPHPVGAAGAAPPAYRPGLPFRLPLPGEALARASAQFPAGDGPRIAILPGGGSARSLYPSLASWELIVGALATRFPDATFCFSGKLAADGRTRTAFGREEFDRLLALPSTAIAAIDIPLIDQLATVAACDLFISPHSGFGMAALAVGTPWLSIAGNRWPEYYFNGVPFISVLPDRDRFPCYSGLAPEPPEVDDDGPRSPSMSRARIEADLDRIVAGAERLIARQLDFDSAMREHIAHLLAFHGGDTSQIWSIDGVHRPYLTAAVRAATHP
jgi:hypothetical protein